MSYEIYTFRLPGESASDCGCRSLLLEDTRKAWSRLALVGKGEHEGTTLTLTKEQVYAQGRADKLELAAFLDRKFLLAHADRMALKLMGTTSEQ